MRTVLTYFSYDRDSSVDMIQNKILAFLQDLKHWMTCNFLKLNESKTKVIEVLSNSKVESKIISNTQSDDSCSLSMPNAFLKIHGVIFDDGLNLEKHTNTVVSTCYANLHNLGRIASKPVVPKVGSADLLGSVQHFQKVRERNLV